MTRKAAGGPGFVPQSPDELDAYIKVTNPGVWVVLALCLVVLAAAFAWGVLDRVDTTVRGVALRSESGETGASTVFMFVTAEEVHKLKPGNAAEVDGVKLEVGSVTREPLSKDENAVFQIVPYDYLRDRMFRQDWGYKVVFVKPKCGERYHQLSLEVAQQPSNEEAKKAMADCEDLSEYGFEELKALPATIITRSVSPISLVFG